MDNFNEKLILQNNFVQNNFNISDDKAQFSTIQIFSKYSISYSTILDNLLCL